MEALSKREIEVLNLIFDDYSSKEISTLLQITVDTVSSHRKNIIQKLKVKSMFGAYLKYLQNN